jgi:hypothetical protein
MLTTVEGVFRDGHIELSEAPLGVEEARVLVTFLPESSEAASPYEANRRMLALLQSWQAEPLTADEERLLDGFDDFQSQHPLRFIHLPDEP